MDLDWFLGFSTSFKPTYFLGMQSRSFLLLQSSFYYSEIFCTPRSQHRTWYHWAVEDSESNEKWTCPKMHARWNLFENMSIFMRVVCDSDVVTLHRLQCVKSSIDMDLYRCKKILAQKVWSKKCMYRLISFNKEA